MKPDNTSILKSLKFGTMLTASGKKINLFDPDPEQISIYDIAASLSKICRFGGNINYFYTVAQHSCLVAWLAEPHLVLPAFLHDAAEAYCGDVIRPLKKMLGAKYDDIEEQMLKAIFYRFGLNYSDYPLIKEYDDYALQLEEQAIILNNRLFQKDIEFKSSVHTTHKSITWCWDHRYARVAFLETWQQIPKISHFNQQLSRSTISCINRQP